MPTQCTMNLMLVMAVVMTATQMISFVVPGWLILETETNNYYSSESTTVNLNYAVWYLTYCATRNTNDYGYGVNEETCVTTTYFQAKVKDSSQYAVGFLEWELEMTFGLLSSLLTLIFVSKQRTANSQFLTGKSREHPTKTKIFLAFVFSCISGSLVLTPVSKLARVNASLKQIEVFGTYKLGFPYGLIFGGIGGSLAVLLALLLLVHVCSRQSTDGATMTTQSGQPLQMAPLMPLHGQVVHGGGAPSAQPLYPGYQPYPADQQPQYYPQHGDPVQYQQQAGGPVQYPVQHPQHGYPGGYYPQTQVNDGRKLPLAHAGGQQMYEDPPVYKDGM